jgi:hypothetical protein
MFRGGSGLRILDLAANKRDHLPEVQAIIRREIFRGKREQQQQPRQPFPNFVTVLS